MNKRLLTLDDLYNFFTKKNKTYSFSSEESGYQLSVQVPAQFEINKEQNDDSLMFCTVKLMHSGKNRNKSHVTDEALHNCAKTIAYKPILANFTEYEDEDTGEILKDFTSHDIEHDEDGNVIYIEKQVGCFTADEPYFEVEKSTKHNFIYCYAAIPRGYTDTDIILERKGGSKISAELEINAMEYDAGTKTLFLTDVTVLGATLLGRNPKTGDIVNEGMKNARIDILDFSVKNNSIFANYENKMIEFQDRLKKLESACFNNTENSNVRNAFKKGGVFEMNKFEELLAKYGKTVEDVTFEYENMTDEELIAKFAEVFEDEGSDDTDTGADTGDTGSAGDTDPSESGTSGEQEGSESSTGEETPDSGDDGNSDGDGEDGEDGDDGEDNDEPDESDDTPSTDDDVPTKKKKAYSIEFNGEKRLFEVSCNDKIWALQELVNATYSEADNAWYGVTVYNSYVVMSDYYNNKHYKQSYSQDGDNFVLTGDRTEVFVNFLTKEQEQELENMKANYSVIQDELSTYKSAEIYADKMTVFEDEAYLEYLETDEFKSLMSKENVDKYSKEELSEKADAAFAKIVKKNKTFSYKEPKKPKKKVSKVSFHAENETEETYKPYGDFFEN